MKHGVTTESKNQIYSLRQDESLVDMLMAKKNYLAALNKASEIIAHCEQHNFTAYDLTDLLLNKMTCLIKLKYYDEAIRFANKYTSNIGTRLSNVMTLAIVQCYEELAKFESVLEICTEEVRFFQSRVRILTKMGRLEEARNLVEKQPCDYEKFWAEKVIKEFEHSSIPSADPIADGSSALITTRFNDARTVKFEPLPDSESFTLAQNPKEKRKPGLI